MKSSETPMMRQYLSIKAQYPDTVLFFRLGDFYEMFDDDAVEVSKLLNLTLTQRAGRPMCGIPHHAARIYIARLLRAGKKIAICEQVTDPIPGELTARKVVEVITPGTASEDEFLEQEKNNYLAALYCTTKQMTIGTVSDIFIGFAYIDVSTGEFFASSFPCSELEEQIRKEIGRVQPREIIIQQSLPEQFPCVQAICSEYPEMVRNMYPDWAFNAATAEKRLCRSFKTEHLKSFDLTAESPELPPAGVLLEYLEQTAGKKLPHVTGIRVYRDSDFVIMDDSTRRNLELVQNLRDNGTAYTLFETVCRTKTPMGIRLLRTWLHHPLCRQEEILERLTKTQELYAHPKYIDSIRALLHEMFDMHRLSGRVAMQRANGKDLLALRTSIGACLKLYRFCLEQNLSVLPVEKHTAVRLEKCLNLLTAGIADDCPAAIHEGGVIKAGWSQELDSLRHTQKNANQLLEAYLEKERKKTGIQNLKIKYNRLMGYFLEVTKGNLSAVPQHFIPRRALANAERFTTEQLGTLEEQLNTVDEHIIECEKKLFSEIIAKLNKDIPSIRLFAQEIARLDVIQSFAYTALLNGWTAPVFSSSGTMEIVNGRHPVVEQHLPSGTFVPNSLTLESASEKSQAPSFALITGPNMAGKSTFLRQTALIVLLAQMGSFVPAERLILTPVDRIFCRVGATDNLARGESTFLVEMTETAYILRNATPQSLVIMDEVGRGTSTGDGLAIAQAVTEYLLTAIGAKTLFATHYHELSQLTHPRMKNFCLDVLEAEGKIVFLKKVVEGAAAHSYGIHVAQLAGLPPTVLQRAEVLLNAAEPAQPCKETNIEIRPAPHKNTQNLFSEEALVISEILSVNTDAITPLDALQMLHRWKKALFPV